MGMGEAGLTICKFIAGLPPVASAIHSLMAPASPLDSLAVPAAAPSFVDVDFNHYSAIGCAALTALGCFVGKPR